MLIRPLCVNAVIFLIRTTMQHHRHEAGFNLQETDIRTHLAEPAILGIGGRRLPDLEECHTRDAIWNSSA
jgi:hypothetical protein